LQLLVSCYNLFYVLSFKFYRSCERRFKSQQVRRRIRRSESYCEHEVYMFIEETDKEQVREAAGERRPLAVSRACSEDESRSGPSRRAGPRYDGRRLSGSVTAQTCEFPICPPSLCSRVERRTCSDQREPTIPTHVTDNTCYRTYSLSTIHIRYLTDNPTKYTMVNLKHG